MGKRDKGTQRYVLIEAVRTSGEPVKAIAARMGVKQSTALLLDEEGGQRGSSIGPFWNKSAPTGLLVSSRGSAKPSWRP
jgi:hypothetical protein